MRQAYSGTRQRKSAVFLLILLSHGLLVEVLMRKGREIKLTNNEPAKIFLVPYLAPKLAPAGSDSPPEPSAKVLHSRIIPEHRTLPGSAAAPVPAAPQVDWQRELELAAENRASEADKNAAYRDLSKSLSPAQLNWLTQHHMEPASPGIAWKSPRVEITKDGLPIIHIDDHCVVVPILLFPMVFCSVGHIEPNGDLFNHMHDPPLH